MGKGNDLINDLTVVMNLPHLVQYNCLILEISIKNSLLFLIYINYQIKLIVRQQMSTQACTGILVLHTWLPMYGKHVQVCMYLFYL